MTNPVWTPDRLVTYPLVEHVHLAPDGRRILFTARTPHMTDEASEFRQQIHLADAATGDVVQLTAGEGASQPRWSPDGQHLAFLRKAPGSGKPGLWLMRADGGEAWPLTGAENGVHQPVTTFRWSRDGRRIAFLAVPHDEEKEKRRKRGDDVLHWRVDYDFAHLHVVAVAAAGVDLPPVTQLTRGRLCVVGLDWAPSGQWIAFTHRSTPLFDSWQDARLATVAADGSQAEPADLGEVANWDASPQVSPDGQWIACEVSETDRRWTYASRLTLIAADGSRRLPLAQVSDEQPILLGWAPDGQAVYVLNQAGLTSELVALPVDGGPPRVAVHGIKIITAHLNAAQQAALVVSDFHAPDSIYCVDLGQAPAVAPQPAPRKVAQPSAAGFPAGPLPQVQILHWRTPDQLEIEGILYLPADYDVTSGQRLPLVLHIHGGPAGLFQRQFAAQPYYYTPAALCEHGIAVLRCNPRGSGGYGKAFRRANQRDWGGGDFHDLMQGVDVVVEMGIADPQRLGIAGWSYGGFMTSWAITQTDRFRAASIGAAVTNPMSFNGTSDIPGFIPDYFGAEAWDDPEFYQARAPIFHVHKVTTPAIIQHGDADTRVPLEQGLQYYNALLRRGVPVEMDIYPRQGHAINEPRLLMAAMRRNVEWFVKMLVEG